MVCDLIKGGSGNHKSPQLVQLGNQGYDVWYFIYLLGFPANRHLLLCIYQPLVFFDGPEYQSNVQVIFMLSSSQTHRNLHIRTLSFMPMMIVPSQ